HLKNTGAHAID
ncbi:putative GTP-binding protein EngB, partial [Haemophilus influenzae]